MYNAEKKVGRCIRSIQKQTYKNLEIICVNDGSKDNSLEVLRKLQQKDGRIKIIDQENQGEFGARKTGIMNATGEYIRFADSDDAVEDDFACEKLIKIFEDNPDVQIISFGFVCYAKGMIKFENIAPKHKGKMLRKELIENYGKDFLGDNGINVISNSACDKIYAAELIKSATENHIYPYKYGGDLFTNLLCFENDEFKNIFTIQDIMYRYNVGIGITKRLGTSRLKETSWLKKYQNELCDKWNLGNDAKYHCNIETIHILKSLVEQEIKNKTPEKEIIEKIKEANQWENVIIAKNHFKSFLEQTSDDELSVLVYSEPKEFYEYVKAHYNRENMLQKIFRMIFKR